MEAIQRHRVTHVYLPPTLVYLLLAHPEVRSYDYSSLKYLLIMAAPIAPEKLREAMDVFGPVSAPELRSSRGSDFPDVSFDSGSTCVEG